MGISPEVAAKVVEAIKADAAAHGGTVRTKRVLESLKAQHLSATAAAVKILAEFLGFKIERGPEQGQGPTGKRAQRRAGKEWNR